MGFSTSDKTVSLRLWEQNLEYNKIEFALWQLGETFEMRVTKDSKQITDNRVNGKAVDNVQQHGTEVTVKPLPWIIDNFTYAQGVLDSTAKSVNEIFNKYGIEISPNWKEINKYWSNRIEKLNVAYTDMVSDAVNAQIHNQQIKFQQAYNEELSRDSGLGFGIISNSFVSHLLYAAQSASKEVKDHKRALKYADEHSGTNLADSLLELINVIYPFYMENIEQNLIKILSEYYAYIVSLFSKELGYNYDDIAEHFNLDKSFDKLDNGEISKETLISALEKNPNNGVIIGYAIQYGYLDTELCTLGHNSSPMFLNRLKNWAIARLSEIYKAGKLFNKPLINDENRIIINGLMDFYKVKYPKLEKCQDWQDILMGAFTQDVAKHLTEMGEIAVAKSNMLISAEFDKLAKSGKRFYLDNESKSLFVCLYHKLYFNGAYTSASFLDLKAPFTAEDIDNSIKELNEKIRLRSIELAKKEALECKEREERQKEAQKQKEIHDKKIKKYALIITSVVIAIVFFVVLLNSVIIPTSKYNNAIELMNAGKYEEAIDAFEELDGYKDSDNKIKECRNNIKTAILEEKYNRALALMGIGKYEEAIKLFREGNGYKDSKEKITFCENAIKNDKYNIAISLYEEEKYEEAIQAFTELKNYMDSKVYIEMCNNAIIENKYLLANAYYKDGDFIKALKTFQELEDYKNSREKVLLTWEHVANRKTFATGYFIGDDLVAIKEDGTIYHTSDYPWINVVEVSMGFTLMVGLKDDGTVVAVGDNDYGQCNVQGWKNIVSIDAGNYHVVGLRADGTVVATGGFTGGGSATRVSSWKNIIAVEAGYDFTLGLKDDGTVLFTGNDPNNIGKQVSQWSDIIAISAGINHAVGLKKDGTVVAAGNSRSGQCNVENWSNIVYVEAGCNGYTFAITSSGEVLMTGSNSNINYKCDVSTWTNIVAIAADDFVVGLKSDGTFVFTGTDSDTQYPKKAELWDNIKLP